MKWLWIAGLGLVLIAGGSWYYMQSQDTEIADPDVVAEIPPPPPEGDEPDVTLAQDNTVEQVPNAGIDWGAAQADIAEQRDRAGESGVAQVASTGGESPRVPILLPTGIVQPASADAPSFKMTEDGYFATFESVKYDIIVNGTMETYGKSGQATGERPPYRFSATDGGAQISLSRYGADYLIEFECKVLDENYTCITEEEALEIAENLVATGGQ